PLSYHCLLSGHSHHAFLTKTRKTIGQYNIGWQIRNTPENLWFIGERLTSTIVKVRNSELDSLSKQNFLLA
uniref:Metallophosphoesterase n=1 Tax=Parascaris univalens TaxID=6257 RepID=A0A915A067_PARUN